MKGVLATTWGIAGVCLLLGSAVYRLGSRALNAASYELSWIQWTVLVVGIFFMAYSEGYKGFQRSFSPRVAARARYLWDHAGTLEAILAPFFLMGYFHAERRRKIVSISLTVGIIGLIVLVRFLSSPWREIVDIGVVVGLVWGVISLLWFLGRAFFSGDFTYSPEVPGFSSSGGADNPSPSP